MVRKGWTWGIIRMSNYKTGEEVKVQRRGGKFQGWLKALVCDSRREIITLPPNRTVGRVRGFWERQWIWWTYFCGCSNLSVGQKADWCLAHPWIPEWFWTLPISPGFFLHKHPYNHCGSLKSGGVLRCEVKWDWHSVTHDWAHTLHHSSFCYF